MRGASLGQVDQRPRAVGEITYLLRVAEIDFEVQSICLNGIRQVEPTAAVAEPLDGVARPNAQHRTWKSRRQLEDARALHLVIRAQAGHRS